MQSKLLRLRVVNSTDKLTPWASDRAVPLPYPVILGIVVFLLGFQLLDLLLYRRESLQASLQVTQTLKYICCTRCSQLGSAVSTRGDGIRNEVRI